MSHPGFELAGENRSIGRRTINCTGISGAVHVLLLLCLVFFLKSEPQEAGVTEITWMEPGGEAAAAELPVALTSLPPTPDVILENPLTRPIREKAEPETPVADIAPEPVAPSQIEDKIGERLALLQKDAGEKTAQIVSLAKPTPGARPIPAGVSDAFRPGSPTGLARSGTIGPTGSGTGPVSLVRSTRQITRAEIVPLPVPDVTREKAAPKDTETSTRRVLAGAQLSGPVADRPVIRYEVPVYPEWAKREAVEGSVTIYFIVIPNGNVKENVMVQKTAGFADFDENAVNALITWRFEPLKAGMTGEQWGTITFNYRLSDAN